MAESLGELWKKGTAAPLASSLVEGGLGIDVVNKKAYSKASDGSIFELAPAAPIPDHNSLGGRDAVDAHPMESITGIQDALNEKYNKTDHIATAAGSGDAGKPIKLNGNGVIDSSMLDTSSFYPVSAHDPSDGVEYPDNTGETAGAFWWVETLANPDGGAGSEYTFTTGDLNGITIKIGDFMVWAASGWGVMGGAMNPSLYYKLDGTNAITAPFSGGAQQAKNFIDGTDATDLTTVQQMEAALEIGSY